MVPGTGLEPACCEARAPETRVSTNSTTRAYSREGDQVLTKLVFFCQSDSGMRRGEIL